MMGIYKQRDRKGNLRYVVSKYWPDNSGRIRHYAPNLAMARQLSSRIDCSIFMGTWRALKDELNGAKTHKKETVREIATRFLAVKVKSRMQPRTQINYVSRIKEVCRLFGDLPIENFGVNEANMLIELRKEEGLKPGTINQDIITMKSLFSFAVEVGALDASPIGKVRMLKVQQKLNYPVNKEEVQRIIELQPCGKTECLVTILAETGLRISEALALKWSDIDFQERLLSVGKSKAFNARRIPLSDLAVDSLRSQIRYLGCDVIFTGRDNRSRMSRWDGRVKKACLEIGIPPLGFHDFRRYRASMWHKMGLETKVVSYLLGHKNSGTTDRYLVIGLDMHKRVIEAQKAETMASIGNKQATENKSKAN